MFKKGLSFLEKEPWQGKWMNDAGFAVCSLLLTTFQFHTTVVTHSYRTYSDNLIRKPSHVTSTLIVDTSKNTELKPTWCQPMVGLVALRGKVLFWFGTANCEHLFVLGFFCGTFMALLTRWFPQRQYFLRAASNIIAFKISTNSL